MRTDNYNPAIELEAVLAAVAFARTTQADHIQVTGLEDTVQAAPALDLVVEAFGRTDLAAALGFVDLDWGCYMHNYILEQALDLEDHQAAMPPMDELWHQHLERALVVGLRKWLKDHLDQTEQNHAETEDLGAVAPKPLQQQPTTPIGFALATTIAVTMLSPPISS